ncbi:MAG: heavy metal translocating P-type ATPase [Candidatus Hodarchaeota archaeon]
MGKKQRKSFIFILEVLLLILSLALEPHLPYSGWIWLGSWSNIFALSCVLIGGVPVFIDTVKALVKKDLTADILFIIALIAAESVKYHVTGATLVLMMGGGELIEEWTIEKTYEHTTTLMDLQPRSVILKVKLGNDFLTKKVIIDEVKPGDVLIVKSGENIPVDGTITRGRAEIDASLVTGENLPVLYKEKDFIRSGMLVVDGFLEIETSRVGKESSLGKIQDMIDRARSNKSSMQMVTDTWAKFFAPIILLIAFLTYLFTSNLFFTLSVLLVSCPCSLALSVPTAFIASIGLAARKGIWLKSGKVIEDIGRVNMLILDKTGTITFGISSVEGIERISSSVTDEELLKIIKSMEILSPHPLAKNLLAYIDATSQKATDALLEVEDYKNLPGLGISGTIPGYGQIFIGNKNLMEEKGIDVRETLEHYDKDLEVLEKYSIFITSKNELLGYVLFQDRVKDNVEKTTKRMRKMGVENIIILTGDSSNAAESIGQVINADLVRSNLLPEDKLQFVKEANEKGAITAMAGDGINDAPAMAISNVGIAMGKNGTALTAQQGDIVLMSDDFSKISYIMRLGKKCVTKARLNIILAVIMNFLGIMLSAFGLLAPVYASLYHVVQSLIVVFNSALLIRPLKED